MKNSTSLLISLFLLLSQCLWAQDNQWQGATNYTGAIYRQGNVGVGMTTAPTQLLNVQNGNLLVQSPNRFPGGSYFPTIFIGGFEPPLGGTGGTPNYGGMVGFGTTTPAAAVHVCGESFLVSGASNENLFEVFPVSTYPGGVGGLVGIGTSNPTAKVEISSYASKDGGTGNKNVVLKLTNGWSSSGGNEPTLQFSNGVNSGSNIVYWNVGADIADGYPLYFRISFKNTNVSSTENELFRITSDGNVGIGTTVPDSYYKLSVNGPIRAKEIRVNTGWSDYVFNADYKMMSLPDLQNYITDNGHLPGIPSACEVEQDGIDLGNMNALLLQKIEELTLYIIELKKEIENENK